MTRTRLAALLLILAVATSVAAEQPDTWQIDASHSSAQFAVRHLAISTVRGRFDKMSGTVSYDPADPAKISVAATIDASTINTHIQSRDNDLRGRKYFDVEQFPTLTFESTRAEPAGPGKLKVTGNLTMHGVTREVLLEVADITGPQKDASGRERMGAVATTKLNRRDFGVNGGGGIVGDQVAITIDLELVR